MIFISWTSWFDTKWEDYTEGAFTKSVSAFALARGLNMAISALQGTNVSGQVVIGVQVSIGEVLDPVNDMIERFSWVMLVSTVSLGIQKILIEIVGSWPFNLLVTIFGFSFLLGFVWRVKKLVRWVPILFKLTILSLLFRHCMGITVAANHLVYKYFLQERHDKSADILRTNQAETENISGQILNENNQQSDKLMLQNESLTQSQKTTVESFLEKAGSILTDMKDGMKSAYESTKNAVNYTLSFDIKAKIHELSKASENIMEHIVTLIIVFLLQSVLIPIGFMFGLMKVASLVWKWDVKF
jgi:hypothetical protein